MKRGAFFLCLVVLAVATCGSPAPSPTASTASPVATAAPTPSPLPVASAPPTFLPEPTAAYTAAARKHIDALTAIGPRVAGDQAERQAASYIASQLAGAGYEPEIRPFTGTGWDHRKYSSANVVAVKAGASPRLIVVGAHYDSVAKGLGADDNASGVAVLLELAELLAHRPTPYTIFFVAFGAEEVGSLGSRAFVAGMTEQERAGTVAMVNLDSVIAGNFLYVYGEEGPPAAARDWVLAWASARSLDLRTIHDVEFIDSQGHGFSDYAPFLTAGIPFIYLEATDWTLGDKDGWTQVDAGYADDGVIRHTRFDTTAWLDATFPGRVDARLSLSVEVLLAFLTEYEAVEPGDATPA